MPVRLRRWRFGIAAMLALSQPLAAAPPTDSQFEQLRRDDAALARIAFRLTAANAPLCDEQMPGTGLVVHSLDQYPLAARAAADRVFGFPAPLAVELVVENSPAAKAALHSGDGLLAAGNLRFAAALPAGARQTSASRDSAEEALELLAPEAPLAMQLVRGGQRVAVTILPVAACRSRFELVPDAGWLAQSDGRVVQLATRYAERMDESELAVAVAHELAHVVLHHRRRLAAAGIGPHKGVFSEFGRSGRLTRRVEDEADALSVVLLRNAGYDPASGPAFWRKWGGTLGGGPFRGRSHGSPAARARNMESEIARIPPEAPAVYIPPLVAARDTPLD